MDSTAAVPGTQAIPTDPSARVRAALAATPPDYLARCLAQRLPGPAACGSVFLDFGVAGDPAAPDRLLHALHTHPWEPYEHPAVMAGCAAFACPLGGRVGLVHLATLAPDHPVRLLDPKGTGFVEAVVEGTADDRTRGSAATFTVAILGPDDGREVVYTFHPGAPIPPSRVPADGRHGTTVTAEEAVALGLQIAKVG